MRLVSCFFTLLVVASVPFHPALAESQSDIDPNTEKFLACDQEKGSLLKTVSSLTKEKVSLEKSVEELQSQLAAKQADGDAQIAVVKAQLKAAQDEAEAVKARADKAEKHVEKTKELHLGAQEQSDLLQAQITRLYVDLKARQENLEEATSAHDALTSQLKAIRSEGDGSRRDLEAQLAAATKAASSEKMGLQGERDMLKTDLEQLQASLREAQLAYLPIWSHSYYAAVRQAAEPALKYHREEIVTGRAYTKARGAAQDAYKTAHAAAHPHLQKVWVVIEPTFSKVYEQIKIYWEKLQTELSKEPYSTYVAKAQGALQALYNHALGLRARAIDLWNSEEANKAKAFVIAQKQSFERDLGNIFTHMLGADVPGSGIDPSFVQTLVQFTLYAIPAILLGVPLLCMRGGKKKGSAGIPIASPAVSKTSKRMRKK